MLVTEDMMHDAFEVLRNTAKTLPIARGKRSYLEAATKSLKAKLSTESDGTSIAAKEMYAYAHQDYKLHIAGLKEAIIEEEKLRLERENASIMTEVWRTEQSNIRAMSRAIS